MSAIVLGRLGDVQRGALQVYVFDPAHDGDAGDEAGVFPGAWDGRSVTIDRANVGAAADWLTEAANSADASGDRQFREALTALAKRVRGSA